MQPEPPRTQAGSRLQFGVKLFINKESGLGRYSYPRSRTEQALRTLCEASPSAGADAPSWPPAVFRGILAAAQHLLQCEEG
ncbi:protein of unknown function [Paraburkholderia dioscoreae]|uniref:Uncharacterized protein n=1 Tax=Paraburkholderia dioscoreae TaxID=2604047 RepID=A0A5Q4YSM0_9BURK|nr:protein of unknown function [Paraburkholderia dioscoreae]